MILNMNGGGGANLNFKIVGGTTQLATAKENTIWVNTDVEITEWAFSPTASTGVEGMVWIQTATLSKAPFNALKKNSIMVYPVKCAQYVNGAWVEKEAKTYQDGEWKGWLLNLKLFPVSTGVPWSYSSENSSRITIADTYIYFSDDNYYQGAFTTNYVDLSAFNTLHISTNFSHLYSGATHRMGVRTNKYSVANYADVSTYVASATPATGSRTVTIDISNVDGGYVTVQGAIRGYVYEVWAT